MIFLVGDNIIFVTEFGLTKKQAYIMINNAKNDSKNIRFRVYED